MIQPPEGWQEPLHGYIGIGDGLCPSGRGRCNFQINLDELKALEEILPWKFYNAKLVGDVIETPRVIFAGLRRRGFESDSFCYSFVPKIIWLDDQKSEPAPAGFVFLGYIIQKKEEVLTVFDWAFRPQDEERTGYPKGWRLTFERVLWEKA